MATPYTPRTPQEFWCSVCDSHRVDSTKPETGSFFLQFGHMFKKETREFDGDHIGVMFAVCCHCKPKES